jgi:hypothetical protein
MFYIAGAVTILVWGGSFLLLLKGQKGCSRKEEGEKHA